MNRIATALVWLTATAVIVGVAGEGIIITQLRTRIAVLEHQKSIPGPAGPTGAVGPAGEPGAPGVMGPRGADGFSAPTQPISACTTTFPVTVVTDVSSNLYGSGGPLFVRRQSINVCP